MVARRSPTRTTSTTPSPSTSRPPPRTLPRRPPRPRAIPLRRRLLPQSRCSRRLRTRRRPTTPEAGGGRARDVARGESGWGSWGSGRNALPAGRGTAPAAWCGRWGPCRRAASVSGASASPWWTRGGRLCIKKKARGFMCGCGSSKAVSISDGSDKQSPMATPPTNMSNTTMTMSSTTTTTTATRRAKSKTASSTAAAPSSFSPSSYADTDDADTSVESMPSVAALLHQLGELERTVRSLQGAVVEGGCGGRRHRRTVSEGGGGGTGRVEESVAVVKESANPLADFRRSMLQMIVEKEIVGGIELRKLLHRFLSLNSPRHHHLILRAFAEIWEEVFAGYERTPDFLVSHRRKKPPYANVASHTAHGHWRGESVSPLH